MTALRAKEMVTRVVRPKVEVDPPVVEVRSGEPGDELGVFRLLEETTAAGYTLPRTMEEIHDTVSTFTVALENGVVLSCAALDVVTPEIGEVRSVAVSEAAGGRGLGRAAVRALIERARALELDRLCLLTKVPGFFTRCGFVEIEPSEMPADFSEMALAVRGRTTEGRIPMMRDL